MRLGLDIAEVGGGNRDRKKADKWFEKMILKH